ncbi:hypothetical protein [Terrabacter sp. C0L_2]|uniref:hypothetical protein n=1 Tax=Terrabacter sp. C0L_2 TaxID=3108389 RepID=UPI002ED1A718|nr:hypothetical protein U5C87_06270 [Terrabacter sp. C0L_2]
MSSSDEPALPPAHDGYRWPTAPAGARQTSTRPLSAADRRRASRTGRLVGVAHLVWVVGLSLFVRIGREVPLATLLVGVVVALVALGRPRARPLARGYLVAVLVGSVLVVVALFVLFFIQIAYGGP